MSLTWQVWQVNTCLLFEFECRTKGSSDSSLQHTASLIQVKVSQHLQVNMFACMTTSQFAPETSGRCIDKAFGEEARHRPRDNGTTGQRTPGQRDNGTTGHRANGTTGQRDTGPTGQRDNGTPGQRDTGPTGQRDTGPTGPRANGAPGQRDNGPTGRRETAKPTGRANGQ